MVAAVLLLQLAVATPPALEAARTHLEDGDTAAAAQALGEIAGAERLTPDAVASLFLLEWLARGGTDDPVLRRWSRLRDPHIRLRADLRSGRVLMGGAVEEAAGDVLIVQREIGEGRIGVDVARAVFPDRTPPDWHADFEQRAGRLEAEDVALLAGALRWARVRDLLAVLDRAAEAPAEIPRCEPDCFRVGPPPSGYRLLARLQGAGHDSTLATLGTVFADLARAPWPFSALAARAHVAVCALLRANPGVAGCWPVGDGLGGRDAAEVTALVHAFRGEHQRAGLVMEQFPYWFDPLDALRDLVDLPARARPRSGGYAPSLEVQEPDPRMPPGLLWKAAWPLYLLPYNERLVVHRARLLLADVLWRLAVDGRQGLFGPFGRPSSIVQVGVPLGAAETESRAILAYYPEAIHETAPQTGGGRTGVPLDLAIVATGSRGTRLTGFASEHYDAFGPLDHQVVQYVRDGRRHVDMHTEWQGEPTCRSPRPLLGLFLLDDGLRELRRTTVPDPQPGRHLQLRSILHPGMYVYSLELFDSGCRRAQRARYVLPVPAADGALLSDLVLADELHYGDNYRGADRLRERQPVTIRPALDFEAGGAARFYWEMYGVAADSLTAGRLRIQFEVVNVRQQRVAIRDLGLVAREAQAARATLDVSYLLNVPAGDAPLTSGLTIGLPPDARGVHVARLTVTDTVTGRTATAQRAFFVRG